MIYAFGARNTAVLNERIIMILLADKLTLKTTVIKNIALLHTLYIAPTDIDNNQPSRKMNNQHIIICDTIYECFTVVMLLFYEHDIDVSIQSILLQFHIHPHVKYYGS